MIFYLYIHTHVSQICVLVLVYTIHSHIQWTQQHSWLQHAHVVMILCTMQNKMAFRHAWKWRFCIIKFPDWVLQTLKIWLLGGDLSWALQTYTQFDCQVSSGKCNAQTPFCRQSGIFFVNTSLFVLFFSHMCPFLLKCRFWHLPLALTVPKWKGQHTRGCFSNNQAVQKNVGVMNNQDLYLCCLLDQSMSKLHRAVGAKLYQGMCVWTWIIFKSSPTLSVDDMIYFPQAEKKWNMGIAALVGG